MFASQVPCILSLLEELLEDGHLDEVTARWLASRSSGMYPCAGFGKVSDIPGLGLEVLSSSVQTAGCDANRVFQEHGDLTDTAGAFQPGLRALQGRSLVEACGS